MRIAAAAFAVAALGLAWAVPTAAARASAQSALKSDWTHAFAVTPDGGFLIGNPKAKFAIVEYGSLTCPHCRHFAETAMKPLIDQYVRPGKASYEFRSFILNGPDLAATLVARCNGPAHFFPTAAQLYATQPEWLARLQKLSKEEQERLNGLPQAELMLAIAKASGILPVAAAHGIPPAKAQACLKDDAAATGLMKIEQAAVGLGVHGTPTFLVNGKQVPAYDWATLEPFLKESGG